MKMGNGIGKMLVPMLIAAFGGSMLANGETKRPGITKEDREKRYAEMKAGIKISPQKTAAQKKARKALRRKRGW
jgi:hypothetical protein